MQPKFVKVFPHEYKRVLNQHRVPCPQPLASSPYLPLPSPQPLAPSPYLREVARG
jgi:hypothetical protein